MQSTTGNPMYALRDVPGKGKGLVAIEKISQGTRILSEEPIITVSRNEPDSERIWETTSASNSVWHVGRNAAILSVGLMRANTLRGSAS
jgi:hypothetical protein